MPTTGNNLKQVKIYLTDHPLNAAAIFVASNGPVLNCGRLAHFLPAATMLRELLPTAKIVLCASTNPAELAQAKGVAKMVHVCVAAPIFSQANKKAGYTNFYQLLQAQGPKAVNNALMVEQGRLF